MMMMGEEKIKTVGKESGVMTLHTERERRGEIPEIVESPFGSVFPTNEMVV